MSTNLDRDEASMHQILGCQADASQAACHMTVRYLYQVLREQPPEMVFAQLLAGFEGAKKDARIVGLNMVQPEDGKISMRDYALHMQMINYLRQFYPTVHVTLHAGELNQYLVPPVGLTFHINDAVQVAKADRIGHGVDITNEYHFEQTLQTMADKHILVEINLASNDDILGIVGKNHPLPLYMQYGVPVTLSTDDEGVSREDLTAQYQRAVTAYQFTYPTLKTFARNSISYAFLAGKNLWQDKLYQQVTAECKEENIGSSSPSARCQSFLNINEKAAVQWELEQRFNQFESRY